MKVSMLRDAFIQIYIRQTWLTLHELIKDDI